MYNCWFILARLIYTPVDNFIVERLTSTYFCLIDLCSLFFWYSAVVADQWLPSLRHITDICLQLVSLLFHIPRICCSSAVVSFCLSYVSQSSCLLELLAITHHVGEHAQVICVFVDLSCWWYSDFHWLDSKLQSCWLLLSSWSSPSFFISTFQKLRSFDLC